MAAMQAQCKKEDHYDFGLRFQMAVMQHAGKLLALDPSLDEMELLALSILEPMWAKADDADRAVVSGLLGDLLGSTSTVPASWTVAGRARPSPVMQFSLGYKFLGDCHRSITVQLLVTSTVLVISLLPQGIRRG